MENILTPYAPKPAGHYSQAIIHNKIIYVSGQLPIDPQSLEKTIGTIEEQTTQALTNLKAIIEASGSDLFHILKTTVYIADIQLWDRVNVVYANFFGDHKPARSIVPTRELHFGYQIEIDAIAVVIDN